MVDGTYQHTQIYISTTYRCKNKNQHSSRCSRKVAKAKGLIQTNSCGYSEGKCFWVNMGATVHHSKQNFYGPQQFNTRRTKTVPTSQKTQFISVTKTS